MSTSFYLLMPTSGDGPSHLAPTDTADGLLTLMCGKRTRQTFHVHGIVMANAGSCQACREAAAAATDVAQ